MKINFSSDGKITWDEFCTFMQLNFTEKEELVKRQKEVVFITPAKTENNPHRHPIQKISSTNDSNFMIMSSVRNILKLCFKIEIYFIYLFTKDGVVSFWTSSGELKRIKKDIVTFFS